MYLDLSEACDTVQRDILISKLEKSGFDERAIGGRRAADRSVLQGKLLVVPSPAAAGVAHPASRSLPQEVPAL